MKNILDDVVVLDLSRVLAAPYTGMILADLGATVYKIERPGLGDDSRQYGPFENGESMYYINLNRGKLGCTLDLKSEEGKEIFKEMVKKADVVIENYRPGTMEKLGLSYEVLKEINPRIVYGSVSGFGHVGPYSQRAGYDIIGQAMGGLMSTTGWPGGSPTRTGTPMGDVLGGLNLAIGVLAALHKVKETGVGEKVDISLVDAVVSAMQNINMIYLAEGRVPQRIGNRYESTYPYDSFEAKDGFVIIGAANDKLYRQLCDLMNKEELKDHPDFYNVTARVKNHELLKNIIEEWTCNYTVKEITDMLNEKGIPGCKINSVDDVVSDKHISKYRNMFPIVDHPVAGKVKVTNNAVNFEGRVHNEYKTAPDLGGDNEYIYKKILGISDEDYQKLKEKGVF